LNKKKRVKKLIDILLHDTCNMELKLIPAKFGNFGKIYDGQIEVKHRIMIIFKSS